MDAFQRFMDTHCPAPRTDAEAIHLGDGRVWVGDASVKLTRKYHVKALEYLVKHRNADTNDPTTCTSKSKYYDETTVRDKRRTSGTVPHAYSIGIWLPGNQ